jgi:single-strand DNA-binding protein
MNNINIIGNIATDLQLKESKGKTYIKFNLAVPRKMKRDVTDFIPCVSFGKTAELIKKYLSKGNRIAVNGQLITNQYEYRGEKRNGFEVLVENIDFIGSTKKSDDKVQGTLLDPNYNKSNYSEDDFPF